MKTTIDSAGRVVIPKQIREAAGLHPNMRLDVSERDGKIEIEPAAIPTRLVEEYGAVFIRADGPQPPPLTAEEVRDTLERLRR